MGSEQSLDLTHLFDEIQEVRANVDVVEVEFQGRKVKLRVEPETVVLIVKAVMFVVGLFNKGDDPAEIKELLTQISNQLEQLRSLMLDVLGKLEELKVLVDHVQVDVAVNGLLGKIATCLDHIPEWQQGKGSETEVRNYLLGLQQDARTCMLFGYAAFSTVGLALKFEQILLAITKTDLDTQRLCFERYRTFFINLNNPTLPGSVAYARVVCEKRGSDLKQQFPPRNNWRDNLGEAHWPMDECCTARADVFRIFNGDLENGFSGEVHTENLHEWCRPHCGVSQTSFLRREPTAPADALKAYEDEKNRILTILNSAHVEYLEMAARANILRKAEVQIQQLIAVSEHLLAATN